MSEHPPTFDDQGWEELQRVWQEPPGAELPRLEKLLKKRTWAIWALTMLDAIGSLAILGAAVWTLRGHPTRSEVGLSVLVFALLAFAWSLVLVIRRGTWRANIAAPAAMLELSVRRCRASIRLALVNQWAISSSMVLGFGLRAIGVWMPNLDLEVGLPVRIAVLLAMFVWFGTAEGYKRRKQAELARLEALLDEYGDARSRQ